MDYKNITVHEVGFTSEIIINRPGHMNALDGNTRAELLLALKSFNENDNQRVAVLSGSGTSFSSGADLSGTPENIDEDYIYRELTESFHKIAKEIRLSSKIFISSIDGIVAGAGMSLAFLCDLAYASPSSRFIMGFQEIGLAPDTGLSLILSRLGGARLLPYLLKGGEFNAEFARNAGLVEVCEKPYLHALEEAHKIASGPYMAYCTSKEFITRSLFPDFDEFLNYEAKKQPALGMSHDFREGIESFHEKRKPHFNGR
ncbi:MAG: enoyl-CoA hydratase-related protein [Ferroplasma sp.]